MAGSGIRNFITGRRLAAAAAALGVGSLGVTVAVQSDSPKPETVAGPVIPQSLGKSGQAEGKLPTDVASALQAKYDACERDRDTFVQRYEVNTKASAAMPNGAVPLTALQDMAAAETKRDAVYSAHSLANCASRAASETLGDDPAFRGVLEATQQTLERERGDLGEATRIRVHHALEEIIDGHTPADHPVGADRTEIRKAAHDYVDSLLVKDGPAIPLAQYQAEKASS